VPANWKKCFRAKKFAPSFARAAAMARTICWKRSTGEDQSASQDFRGLQRPHRLLTYFADAIGLVTFHGPMVAKDWAHEGGVEPDSWQSALAQAAAWDVNVGQGSGVIGLVDGAAEGILYGGCLSILVASLGTPYEIKPAGSIFFMEDVAAKPYQIDRMLMQMKLAGKFADTCAELFSARCGIACRPRTCESGLYAGSKSCCGLWASWVCLWRTVCGRGT
jgi:hypothetical protein